MLEAIQRTRQKMGRSSNRLEKPDSGFYGDKLLKNMQRTLYITPTDLQSTSTYEDRYCHGRDDDDDDDADDEDEEEDEERDLQRGCVVLSLQGRGGGDGEFG
ncbi:uncharacterized protein LOC144714170 isoform X2 [Wolffia australiana]